MQPSNLTDPVLDSDRNPSLASDDPSPSHYDLRRHPATLLQAPTAIAALRRPSPDVTQSSMILPIAGLFNGVPWNALMSGPPNSLNARRLNNNSLSGNIPLSLTTIQTLQVL
ncbi:hypothetical protein RHGRI_014038 [Rhododendron griersonianum]|uniref:Uncharacterized protein n=1 Tax=Rhododendron griersonianum TaxID=479676 RepID=A0AAV6K8E6_9ERIC|nr:hypothetical protein RHGRI_014038 [Rhododendron griersonianum]